MIGSDGYARGILDALRRQGWRIERGRHVRAVPPDPTKAIVFTATTPSDYRGTANWLRDLKRSGFIWPEEERR